MTAVLPDVRPARPATAGRHRAPEDAPTGPIGVVPVERRARAAHDGHRAGGHRHAAHTRTGETPLRRRAARTAGLSLAALGALATAGGLAADNLVAGPAAEEAPATGELALSPQLASADLALGTARPVSSDAAISSVLPVASPAATATPVTNNSPDSRAGTAAPAARDTDSDDAESSESSDEATEAAPAASSVGARALAEARSQIGVPYVWGGTSPSGFDCSGLMQWAFEQVGEDLPRTSAAQSKTGESISRDELRPGDLIFFNSPVSHVAMYAGNGQMVEAPNSGKDVRTSALSRRMDDVVGYRRV